jgi:hypothetical protein
VAAVHAVQSILPGRTGPIRLCMSRVTCVGQLVLLTVRTHVHALYYQRVSLSSGMHSALFSILLRRCGPSEAVRYKHVYIDRWIYTCNVCRWDLGQSWSNDVFWYARTLSLSLSTRCYVCTSCPRETLSGCSWETTSSTWRRPCCSPSRLL